MSIAPPQERKKVSSNYTTDGEGVIYVESGGVTITISSQDIDNQQTIRVFDSSVNAGSNPITIQTEGSEKFQPGGTNSININEDGRFVKCWCDGQKIFAEKSASLDHSNSDEEYNIQIDGATVSSSDTVNFKTQ